MNEWMMMMIVFDTRVWGGEKEETKSMWIEWNE